MQHNATLVKGPWKNCTDSMSELFRTLVCMAATRFFEQNISEHTRSLYDRETWTAEYSATGPNGTGRDPQSTTAGMFQQIVNLQKPMSSSRNDLSKSCLNIYSCHLRHLRTSNSCFEPPGFVPTLACYLRTLCAWAQLGVKPRSQEG